MNFSENQVIYLQIADLVIDRILAGQWSKEEKIPSVRDLAVELQVNPNTVMRAYDILQQKGIITNKRGVGNFVSPESEEIILQTKKERFLSTDMPLFFKNLYLMKIGFEELENRYNEYVEQTFKQKNPDQ
ncbi:MAG: GntR family transcriptional regulator [Bacteroidales bacterium]